MVSLNDALKLTELLRRTYLHLDKSLLKHLIQNTRIFYTGRFFLFLKRCNLFIRTIHYSEQFKLNNINKIKASALRHVFNSSGKTGDKLI